MRLREIKFRVWDKNENRFLPKDKTCYISNSFLYSLGSVLSGENSNLEFQQFTGLKDKNGEEIWEGDIVKIGAKIGEVYFAAGAFMIKGVDLLWSGVKENQYSDGEVVGNIFENAELI